MNGYKKRNTLGNQAVEISRYSPNSPQFNFLIRQAKSLCQDIWVKIMGNTAYNPTSALTLGAIGEMVNDPGMEQVLRRLMAEVIAVGRALGEEPNASIDERIETSRNGSPSHKTSMLQDIERGRMMEINPIIGAVAEMGKLAGVETPTVDTVLALVTLRARLAGLLPE